MTARVHTKAFAAAPGVADAYRLVECLAALKEKPRGQTMAVLGLDPRARLGISPARKQREGVFRHARSVIAGSEAPFLGAVEARGLFSDERRKKRDSQLGGISLLILCDESRMAGLLCAVQALVCCVSAESSALPFIYPFCEAMRENKKHVPIELIIVGEARLEKAAEYYTAQKKEMTALDPEVEFRFCGSVYFDPEQKKLADSLGLPFLELFPGRTTHGEIMAVSRRFFSNDLSDENPEPADVADRLLSVLASEPG